MTPEAAEPPFRLPALAVVAGVTVFALLQLAAFRVAGVFEYPLDDPYIHLAMAEQMAAGGYGVNAAEFGSAASSPLYPVLLMPFAGTGAQRWLPLVWNLAGLAAAAWLWGRILVRGGYGAGAWGAVLAVAGPVALNFAGLAQTGMEHSLHLAASLAIVLGLLGYLDTGRIGAALVLGLLLAPLLRYEGLALALLAALAVTLRRPGPGLSLAALAVLPVALFTGFLVSLGLDPLPNSVMAKLRVPPQTDPGQPDGPLGYLLAKFATNPEPLPVFLLLGAILITAALLAIRGIRQGPRAALLWVLLGAGLAHLAVGRYGWMDRYEIYIVAAMTAGLVAVAGPPRPPALRLAPALPLLGAAALYLPHLVERNLWAPRSVHLQQAQMARFAKEHWRAPVAVNDLGHVSWNNPHYVLDLWGLGSAAAQRARFAGGGPGWADRLTDAAGVRVAMIYDELFPAGIGADWVLLGRHAFTGPIAGVSARTVSYYATDSDPQTLATARAHLRDWSRGLPRGAEFRFAGGAGT